MTLRQDCELWATFDAEDVDPNRGIVRDRSGKGRTLEASGGPTYGQPSPVGEAVGFDGSDDFFDVPSPLDSPEYTVATLVKPVGTSSGSFLSNTSFSAGFELGRTGVDANTPRLEHFDADGNSQKIQLNGFLESSNLNEYHLFTASFDGENARVTANATEAIAVEPVDGHSVKTTGEAEVGRRPRDVTAFFDSNMTFVAFWSRALSDAEIDELNRMTDRMVSKL